MIKERFLLEWARQFPWRRSEQVEQDLLISRTVVAIYSDPYLAERLAWRGGTALYKSGVVTRASSAKGFPAGASSC